MIIIIIIIIIIRMISSTIRFRTAIATAVVSSTNETLLMCGSEMEPGLSL